MFWLLCKNNSEHDKTGETQGFQPDTDFKLTLHLPLTQNHLTMLRICNLLHTVWHFHCFVLLMIYFLQKYLEHLSHTWRNKIQLTSTCIGFKACLVLTWNLVEIKAGSLIMPPLINGDVLALLKQYLSCFRLWRHMYCCEIAPPPPSWLTHPWCVYTHTNTNMSQHMSAQGGKNAPWIQQQNMSALHLHAPE